MDVSSAVEAVQAESGQAVGERQQGKASTSGREERGEPSAASSPRRAGQAGVRDLGSGQRQLMARAVDTAILKVTHLSAAATYVLSACLSQCNAQVFTCCSPSAISTARSAIISLASEQGSL